MEKIVQAVRDSEREAREILATRERQEADIKLVTPFYDIIREASLEDEDEPEEEVVAKSEYIAPYLPSGGIAALTTRQQALDVREQCLQVGYAPQLVPEVFAAAVSIILCTRND